MKNFVYFGTYTATSPKEPHRKEGIYVYEYDPVNGFLTFSSAVQDVQNPSFLGIHPSRRFLYAVNELHHGQASAFAVDPTSGVLTYLNSQPTDGSAPCYVSFDPEGKWLLVPNYGNGTLAVFPILPSGELGPHSDYVVHKGSGQENAHAHSVLFDPSGRFVLAADLGIDQVLVYTLDRERGKLKPHQPTFLKMPAGAGPRHMAFHPNGKVLYIANELNSTVTTCSWDAVQGKLEAVQTFSTLPADFQQWNSVADIHITAEGRFLYVSNRGHHSLAIFQAAPDGTLTPVGHAPSGGEWPRNFALLPPGDRILVANEHTDNAVTYRIDSASGKLIPTGSQYRVPRPVCVLPVQI
jgi:6-phosphogluconolactonase